ncbi:heat-shock protein Hsp70 [Bacteroides heparinolyticus]|uniref:Hsp70 family protein n=1 Tax=Prevotella heparinolytica TaxID=28113 RepID=UPI000D02ABD7|nr:Hsp70 family protein [Bacteroides heparinolyticus]AVM58238.1 heat-shock protein Hsp70 [Bacteroides heparinolyticus]
MARIKIDYGIDLGTTNSAICRMEKGEPVVIKTDVLKDTMPSCVSFTKRKSVKAGDSAFNDMKSDKRRASKAGKKGFSNAYVEFKRTMATDTRYHSSFMERDYSSEELSAEVLKTLKSFVTDESFSSVVITVPAKFTVNQKTATMEAAQLAGFRRCELLQEPIAAAMAYGLTAESKNGIWLVFDFGGGTFDAALLKVEDGIMQVFDTEGDNYLGGKNLDYAIVDNIIMPYLVENFNLSSTLADADKKEVLRDAMKTYAEEVKNQLSFKEKEDILSNLGELGEDEDGEEIELDLTVTQETLFNVIRPYFQKTVDICKNLLQRNHLSGSQINKLILVGGPTYSPLIRQMLKEQITQNVDTSIDPMTAVATGAALYASTMDAEVNLEDIELGTISFDIGYESTSVETTEWVSVKLVDNSRLPKVWVELVRSDKSWSSGKVEVGTIGNIIEANLLESKANSFNVVAYDEKGNILPCFPSEFTIIQGTKVGAAPLPYNIGIATWSVVKKRGVFRMAKGLEKNKPVPATGVINDLKTTSQLRPGVESDKLTIPVYQVDDFSGAEGRSASLYEYVADVVITGDDIETLISADSSVDVTLKVDTSEQMTLEVHFLASDITVEKKLDTSKKQSVEDAEYIIRKQLIEAQQSIDRLEEANISTATIQEDFDRVKEEAKNSSEKKAVLQHLKEVLRKIESLDESTEWQRLETELRDEFDRLEKAQNNLGNEKTAQLVEQLRTQTDQVIRSRDVRIGREILEQINGLFVHLTLVYQCMGLIRDCYERFSVIRWRDVARARQLLNQGLEEINNQPTVERLHPIACSLIELMPDDEAENAGGLLKG